MPTAAGSKRVLEIVGARTHNLKNVSASIPHSALTVITGPSGSGKSSLAFDTLYAEGQRRYVESLSTYARQFIEKMARPDVDRISGLQPAIAIEQKNAVRNARSTIGTATEISDYLRLLWARAGVIVCPKCNTDVTEDSPETVVAALLAERPGARLYLTAPAPRAESTDTAAFRAELLRAGFSRVLHLAPRAPVAAKGKRATPPALADLAATALHLEDDADTPELKAALTGWGGFVRVVVDRVVPDPQDTERIDSAVALAFQAGRGSVEAWHADNEHPPLVFRSGLRCNGCGTVYQRPEPNLFSFNSPVGACKACSGFGRTAGIDWDLVIPDKSLCLGDSFVAPFNTPSFRSNYKWLRKSLAELGLPMDVAILDLEPEQWDLVRFGRGKQEGVKAFFDWLDTERYKVQNRILAARYRGYSECMDCRGTRLGPEAQAVRWAPDDQSIPRRTFVDATRLTIDRLHEELSAVKLSKREQNLLGRIFQETVARLSYLHRVGLGYLTLDRQTRTLSGGEAQRINLATALGTALTRTLYVLDEPTVGLHPRDTRRLLSILGDLRNLGNTIVVVEHDAEVILGADHLIDMGPHAGSRGGQIIYSGSPEKLLKSKQSTRTADALRRMPSWPGSDAPALASPTKKAVLRPEGRCISIRGARMHNLRGVDVDIPIGKWTCITGVSGSGKSTLVHRILVQHFNRTRGLPVDEVGHADSMTGHEGLVEMVVIDQSPVVRNARSNPVTYVKAWDPIRTALSTAPEARALRLTPSSFSFNAGDGRCETCEGSGVVTYDMHFVGEMTLPCEACGGKRFGKRVLQVHFRDKTVDDLLNMTIDDAVEFFGDMPPIVRRLRPLQDVGLGYITMGQSTATLSGGEAQRLKLAAYLALNPSAGPTTAVVFDEPTTGLSLSDVEVLNGVFRRLVEQGFTLVVIEHHLEVIRQADWVIDLGPEAGQGGGRVVAAGPAEHVATVPESHTGRFLAEILTPPKKK